jgi:hypothetical protein
MNVEWLEETRWMILAIHLSVRKSTCTCELSPLSVSDVERLERRGSKAFRIALLYRLVTRMAHWGRDRFSRQGSPANPDALRSRRRVEVEVRRSWRR